jgi:hypothetical protein
MADDVTWNNTSRHLDVYRTSSSSLKSVKLYPPSGNVEVALPRGTSTLLVVFVVVPVVRSRRTRPSPSARRARAHAPLSLPLLLPLLLLFLLHSRFLPLPYHKQQNNFLMQ